MDIEDRVAALEAEVSLLRAQAQAAASAAINLIEKSRIHTSQVGANAVVNAMAFQLIGALYGAESGPISSALEMLGETVGAETTSEVEQAIAAARERFLRGAGR